MEYNKIGYSLWITPEKRVFKKLQKIINKFSNNYKTPKFKPHITIHSYLNKKKISKIKFKNEKKFKINLTKIVYGKTYFNSVFFKINKDKYINSFYRKTLKFAHKTKFKPHLSIVYTNNKIIKKKIYNEMLLEKNLKKKVYVQSVKVIKFNEIKKKWKIVKNYNLIGK
tara:strand:- start:28 stop:531 length:504 start_codon:yes stop_codon:yes gene_type:complete